MTQTGVARQLRNTQVGTWTCGKGFGLPVPFACPQVLFPKAFGGSPKVVITGCGNVTGMGPNPQTYMCLGRDHIEAQQVTPQGFAPVVGLGNFSGPGGPADASRIFVGTWVAVGPPPASQGTASPRYMVLLVVYEPPGTNGGRSTSQVVYEAGSTAGTNTGVSNTFKQSYAVSVDTGVGLLAMRAEPV